MEKDFEFQEFLEDDDGTDEFLDAFVEFVLENVDSKKPSIGILNPMRAKQIEFCYTVMRWLTNGTKAKVTYTLNEPLNSMGTVSVEGNPLMFTNSLWFSRAAEFASNMEVYPLAKNLVRLTFTFHGLTNPI